MSHNFYPYLGNAFLDLLDDYAKYKGKTNFPAALFYNFHKIWKLPAVKLKTFTLDKQWQDNLRFVRIYFDTPTFDRITKDRAAKFVDILSAIGGTMGLLTGFSIISAVEVLYFSLKFLLNMINQKH